VQMCN
jgi:TRAP-type C4-dicarboxylate transport system permease large subunit